MELHSFFIILFLSLIVVISILANTYLFTVLDKTTTFYCYLSIQVLLILWMLFSMGELFSPTPEKLALCRSVELFIAVVILPVFIYLLFLETRIQMTIKTNTKMLLTTIGIFTFSIIIFTISEFFVGSFFYYTKPANISLVFTAVAFLPVSKNRFSRNSELSLKNVISNIGDCIIVLDTKSRIMDAKLSFFEKLFPSIPDYYKEFAAILGSYAPDSCPTSELFDKLQNYNEYDFELQLTLASEAFYYRVKTTSLYNDRMARIGAIVTFHDITDNKKLVIELDNKNSELTLINEKLKDYLLVVNQLEEAKQKKEIVFSIQNSIGQEIMELLSMLEVARIKANEKNDSSIKELELATDSCRKVIGEIRGSVSILMQRHM